MAKIRVCYEEDPDWGLVPVRMVITFEKGRFKWNAQRFPVPLNAPFERIRLEDFESDCATISVTQAELTRDVLQPDRFFINIPLMVARLETLKNQGEIHNDFDYEEIRQFMLWMGDIEDVMLMNIKPFYDWRQS